jgi:hypothetical protein
MKRIVVLFSLFAVMSLSSVARAASTTDTNLFAQSGRFGLGLGSGTFATGATAKFYLADKLALQGILGLGYGWGFGANINVDVVYEMPKIWGNDVLSINWHIGGGGALALYRGSSTGIGIEAVGGPSLQLAKVPLEFVVDLRPTFYFGSGWNTFYPGAGSSVRYFF